MVQRRKTTRTTAPRRVRRTAGRPAGGSDEVVRAVLDAALRQLVAQGYAALSIDAVARVAGVNKTTIYRRWPTKSELILAALQAGASRELPANEPSNDLRGDLIAMLTHKARGLASPRGRAVGLALLNLHDDPRMVQALRAQRFRLPASMVQRAIDRGELPAQTDPVLVSEMLLAPIILRVLLHDQPAGPAYVEALVDGVLAGLMPQG